MSFLLATSDLSRGHLVLPRVRHVPLLHPVLLAASKVLALHVNSVWRVLVVRQPAFTAFVSLLTMQSRAAIVFLQTLVEKVRARAALHVGGVLSETAVVAIDENDLVFGLLKHLVQVRVLVRITDVHFAQVAVLSLLHDDNIRTVLRSRLSASQTPDLVPRILPLSLARDVSRGVARPLRVVKAFLQPVLVQVGPLLLRMLLTWRGGHSRTNSVSFQGGPDCRITAARSASTCHRLVRNLLRCLLQLFCYALAFEGRSS